MGGIPTSRRLRLTEIAEALGNPPLGRWLGVAMPIRFWCGGVHRLPTVTDALERGAGRLLQGRPTGSSCPCAHGARHLAHLHRSSHRRGAVVGLATWIWPVVMLPSSKRKTGGSRRPLHQRVPCTSGWEALTNLPHRVGEVFRRPDGLPYERPKHSDDTSAGSRVKQALRFPASVGNLLGLRSTFVLAPVLPARSRGPPCGDARGRKSRSPSLRTSGIKPAPIQENPDVRGSYPDRRGVT